MSRRLTYGEAFPGTIYFAPGVFNPIPANAQTGDNGGPGAYTSTGFQTAPGPGLGAAKSFLYENGVLHNESGDFSGATFQNVSGFIGTSINPADPDILYMASGNLNNVMIWDERTVQDSGGTTVDLYAGAANRYGLPGGGTNQTQAIDVIIVGQRSSANDTTHRGDTNLINLSYNNVDPVGGPVHQAYNTNITLIGGPGRDLFVAGEGNDVLYGGDERSGLGDGLWGGGGDDTIFGGSDFGALLGGADDLFGYAGNDIIYGGSDGDVYYGDGGTDYIYGATSGGALLTTTDVQARVGSISGTNATFFGGDGNDTMFASTGNSTTKEFFFGGNPLGTGLNAWNDRDYVDTPNGADTGLLDVVSYRNGTIAVNINLTPSAAYAADVNGLAIPNGTLMGTGAGGAVNDRFFGIEGLEGSLVNDTLTGNTGANWFNGWSGRDSIFGGDGNDTVVGHQDGLKGDNIVGWDGTSGTGVTIAGNNRIETQDLIINGGLGTDIFNISPDGDTGNTTGSYYNGYATGAQILTGIEIIVASAGADVINLTNGSNAAHDESVSIFAGNGNDVVFSGSANDLIVGDDSSGTASARPGSDTLFGGSGDDLIWGDYQGQPNGIDGAADTLYGGDGNDTIYGGTGDDKIFDTNTFDSSVNSTSIDGGVGSDTINAAFSNAGAKATISGGSNIDTGTPANNDGADSVFTSGVYDSVGANLGLGNDIFSGSQNAGVNKDIVDGQDGNDAIAGWIGGDTLFGGKDDDVLWGGAGSDIIYGGPGDDVIYPDTGGSDTMFGGTGIDYYYLSRADGRANQIYDEFRDPSLPDPVSAENYLVINPVISVALDNGDNYVDGTGVWESDRTITDDDGTDMVTVAARGPGSPHEWVLTVHNVGRDMSVNFDDRDITQIVLWNNDAGTIGSPNYNDAHTFQLYKFDGTTWVFDTEY